MRQVEIAWNGCGQRWQTGVAWACWGQQAGGYGDGIGTAALPLSVSAAVAAGCVWIESQYAASAPLSQTGSLAITRAGL